MNTRWYWAASAGLVVLLFSVTGATAPPPRAPAAPADVAFDLVPSDVASFALVPADYKVFWHSAPPPCLPLAPAATASTDGELISRIASYGSLVRQLYDDTTCGNSPRILSNIIADSNYV